MSQVPLGRRAAKRPPLWLPYPGEGFFPTVTVEVPEIFPPRDAPPSHAGPWASIFCALKRHPCSPGSLDRHILQQKKLPVFVGAMP